MLLYVMLTVALPGDVAGWNIYPLLDSLRRPGSDGHSRNSHYTNINRGGREMVVGAWWLVGLIIFRY